MTATQRTNSTLLALLKFCVIGSISFRVCTPCHAQTIQFSWTPATNRLANSFYSVKHGAVASGNYREVFLTQTNSITLDASKLASGINYFAVSQIDTNAAGQAMETPASGEVQVVKNPSIAATLPLMASTNLGHDWTVAGAQTIVLPTVQAQQFFIAGQLKIAATNLLSFPPVPN